MSIDTEVLVYALDYISELAGTCPYDQHDFQPFGGCEVECGKHQISTCWFEYFKSKVVG